MSQTGIGSGPGTASLASPPLMKPNSVAVVGASQRPNRATRVIANLQRFGYAGRVFPVNAKYTDILGLPCYPDLASLPEVAAAHPPSAVAK